MNIQTFLSDARKSLHPSLIIGQKPQDLKWCNMQTHCREVKRCPPPLFFSTMQMGLIESWEMQEESLSLWNDCVCVCVCANKLGNKDGNTRLNSLSFPAGIAMQLCTVICEIMLVDWLICMTCICCDYNSANLSIPQLFNSSRFQELWLTQTKHTCLVWGQ